MSAVVHLRVVALEDRKPIANAHVGVFARFTEARCDLVEARTDERGEARLVVAISDGETAEISHVARARGRSENRSADLVPTWSAPSGPSPPRLASGDSLDLEIALERGVTLTGRVSDEDGVSIADARIGLVLSKSTSCSWPYSFGLSHETHWPPPCATDACGTFEWLSFPVEVARYVGGRWVLLVEHVRLQPAWISSVESIPPDENGIIRCDVVLRRGRELSGVVLSPSGEPVTSARVRAVAEQAADQPVCVEFEKRELSGNDGRFRFFGLAPGRHSVQIEARGFAPVEMEVDLSSPDAERTVRLVPGLDFTGRVVDEEGRPLGDLPVWTVFGEAGFRRETTTDADGRFTLHGLPLAGEIVVRSHRLRHRIELPATDVVLKVPRARDVFLRLLADESGEPLAMGSVSLLAPGWSMVVDLEPGGIVTVHGAVPGDYEARVDVPDRGPHGTKFQVHSDFTVEPDVVRVPRGSRVRGRITDSDGTPVEGALVFADEHAREALSDADGCYELPPLAERTYLVIQASGFAVRCTGLIDLPPGESPHTMDFELQRGSRVEGRVRRADGSAAPRALVKVWMADYPRLPFELPSAISDASGKFVIEHVPGGTYLVGTGGASQEIESNDGWVAYVELVVP